MFSSARVRSGAGSLQPIVNTAARTAAHNTHTRTAACWTGRGRTGDRDWLPAAGRRRCDWTAAAVSHRAGGGGEGGGGKAQDPSVRWRRRSVCVLVCVCVYVCVCVFVCLYSYHSQFWFNTIHIQRVVCGLRPGLRVLVRIRGSGMYDVYECPHNSRETSLSFFSYFGFQYHHGEDTLMF